MSTDTAEDLLATKKPRKAKKRSSVLAKQSPAEICGCGGCSDEGEGEDEDYDD